MRLFPGSANTGSAQDLVGALFVARRAALKAIRSRVLAASGLTPELAELLLELYLAGQRGDGSIPTRDLLAAVDYTPGLLSRRIGWLCQRGWVESRKATRNLADGVHGNCRRVRITGRGKTKFAPIWRKYVEESERLLTGVSASDLAACQRVQRRIAGEIHAPLVEKRTVPPPTPPKPVPPRQWVELEKEFLD